MQYNQKYAHESQYPYACAPTESFHVPAYYHESELPSSAWNGHRHRSNRPYLVPSQAPTSQLIPINFYVTPGYYHSGCWYNAGLQQPSAPPQLQQHVPQFYIISQREEHPMPLSYPLQQQQVMPSSSPSEPVQQSQVIAMAESPRNLQTQVSQVLEAPGPQETTQTPPQLEEISLGPGVHVTRSHGKLTIDIGLSNAQNAATEEHGCMEDMISELFQLIKGFAIRNRVPRPRRNRFRHQVTSRRPYIPGSTCGPHMNGAMRSPLMEDKDTQTTETLQSDDVVPSQMEVLPVQVPKPAGIPVTEDHISALADSFSLVLEAPLTSSTLALIPEEHSSIQPVAEAQNDLICHQDPDYIADPEQQKLAQPMATSSPTPKLVNMLESKTRQPMISACLEPVGKATPLLTPEVFELKEPIVDTCYWPPLGSRLPTKAVKGKQLVPPAKSKDGFPKQQHSKYRERRFNENRFVGSRSGTSRQVRDKPNGFHCQPRRIPRNLPRSKPIGGKAKVGVPKVPAADPQQYVKAPQNSALNSKNDANIPKGQRVQNQRHSVQSSKRKHPQPQSVVGNMFALLDEPGAEPLSEIRDGANTLQAGGEEKVAHKREAKKSKKLKRQIKKKERAEKVRQEAKVKAAREVARQKVMDKLRSPTPEVPSSLCEAEVQKVESTEVVELPTENEQDIIPKQKEDPTDTTMGKPVPEDVPIESPAKGHMAGDNCIKPDPAEEGNPTANVSKLTSRPFETAAKETVEEDQVANVVASLKRSRRIPLRSEFLDAVSRCATARKSPDENQLLRKRKLWEKRKPDV